MRPTTDRPTNTTTSRQRLFTSIATLILVPLMLASPSVHAADQPLTIHDAWIAEAPPVSKVLAAYMVIKNHSREQQVIVATGSEDFDRTSIHKTIREAGVARMVSQEKLTVRPKGAVVMEPGGIHMMLYDPARPLRAGDEVRLSLTLESGETIDVTAEVREMPAHDNHDHHHGHHHHH